MTIAQKDMFTKRWRKVRAPDPKESQIQISLMAQLLIRLRRDVIVFHVPNGEMREKPAAAKLKAMGTLPGVPDLVFIWRDVLATHQPCSRILLMELKAPGRKQTAEQKRFEERAIIAGAMYECVDNIDDAITLLQSHRLLAR